MIKRAVESYKIKLMSSEPKLKKKRIPANLGIANLPLEITMEATDYKKGVLSVIVDNQSGYDMSYSTGYRLYKIEKEEILLKQQEGEDEGINDLEKIKITIDLNNLHLQSGQYKLVMGDLSCNFELKK